ncbi:protein SRG1-like [Chenopodium quinoa]|uniref:Fe2OG dioxygenase domain-containing protein n=1 Tax=Chenopodium quinoa TaxID=63459 RepID=A0A803MDJ9_CHEQI|nr:protein SRG1-like [Chenopodium quinoa]
MDAANKNQSITVGKSILVPSVQELAKGSLAKVPERYVQINQNPSIIQADNDLQVPIINFEKLINKDGFELEKFHSACQDWGFFQLINHGIDTSLLEKFKLETDEFFNMPVEEKKKYWQTPGEVEGFGQAFVVSEEQKLDWADIFFLTTLPKHQRKPNLLPMLPLPYRDTMENYSIQLPNLDMKLLDCMSKALKIDTERMTEMFGDHKGAHQSLRMNYYPPCPQPEKVIGLTPHSDAVALTILLQFNEVEGLQIQKDGKWVPINPLPNAFVVNIGDILEIMSNGIYKSILHRSVVNETREIISVAAFHSPAFDKDIGPIPSLITPNTPARFKRVSYTNYLKGLFTRALDGKSYLDVMRINEQDA